MPAYSADMLMEDNSGATSVVMASQRSTAKTE